MNILWLDNETRSRRDVTVCGAYELAADPELRLLCVSYALNDEPVRTWNCSFAGGDPEAHEPVPDDLMVALQDDGTKLVAWNAAFERLTLNAVRDRYGLPFIPVEKTICAAALARAHNLPGALGTCTKEWLPADKAKIDGKPTSWMWRLDVPLEATPEHEKAYREGQIPYCEKDVDSMRSMWELMLPPTDRFLREYWVSEHINDVGIFMDLDLIDAAIKLAPEVDAEVRAELADITGGVVKPRGPSFLKWLQAVLPPDMQKLLYASKKKKKGYGWITETRPSSNKAVRAALLEAMEGRDDMDDIREAIACYDEANRAAVSKYKAGRDRSSAEGLLRGLHMFNGASQTGRYSGSGIQHQNLKRAKLKDPNATIATVKSADAERIKRETGGTVNEALSSVLRTSFKPGENEELIWSDWSAIEARVLPWLSADPDADPLLEVFRNGGDVYIREASGIYGVPESEVDSDMRQAGKVAILACGFSGSVGAYQAMAKNYGMKITDERAKEIVMAWREANPWAPRLWKALQNAAFKAIGSPGAVFEVGRLKLVCVPGLLRNSLLIFLPSGRFLCYPEVHVVEVEKEWPDGRVSTLEEVAFRHPSYGLTTTTGGKLAENVTQGEAASLLRHCLVDLFDAGMVAALTVHDEIAVRVPKGSGRQMVQALHAAMVRVPDWAEGLPLAAEAEWGPRYKVSDGSFSG